MIQRILDYDPVKRIRPYYVVRHPFLRKTAPDEQQDVGNNSVSVVGGPHRSHSSVSIARQPYPSDGTTIPGQQPQQQHSVPNFVRFVFYLFLLLKNLSSSNNN